MLSAATAGAALQPDAEQIRAKTTEVFSRPEFDPTPGENFWLRILREFFLWLGSLYTNSPVLYWVLLVGCISLLLLIVGHIVYTLYRALTVSESQSAQSARAARQRLSASYSADASRLAEAGDYTEAIRCLFLSLVFYYDEAGRVPLKKSLTNHEYLALLDQRLPVRNDLEVLVSTIDDYWYGQRAADQSRFQACQSVYDRLKKA